MTETVMVAGIERDLPVGVELLKDSLYLVPFDLLSLSERTDQHDGKYTFVNPRHLGAADTATAQGLDDMSMEELDESIREKGFLGQFLCRWVLHDDNLKIQIIDGERRFKVMTRQISRNDKVYCTNTKRQEDASKAYRLVPCRITVADDKEALSIAFMMTDRSIAWGDGATAKLIQQLRQCDFKDDEILAITKKSLQWLREMDSLCFLDATTFGYLVNGRINRNVALRLARIKDVDRRVLHLHAAYDDAVMHHQEDVDKIDHDLEKAENKEELLEAQLAEAKESGDDVTVAQLEPKLNKAQSKAEDKRRQRGESSKPRAKTKNLRAAAIKIAEQEGTEISEDVAQTLRPSIIKQQYEIIQKLIENDGKDEDGKILFPVSILQIVSSCYKAILIGEEDILKSLRRQRNIQKVIESRTMPKDILADMQDDDEDEDEDYEDEDYEDEDEDEDYEDEDEDYGNYDKEDE